MGSCVSNTDNQTSYPFGIQGKYSARCYTINNFTH
ncbi:hypothetical protein VPH184E373B_0039 [Vibrio phage 184E37-3b]